MSNKLSLGKLIRNLIENLIRSVGRLVLPLLILLMRSARFNTDALKKRSKSIQQIVGLLSLISLSIILIILWGGWQLVSLLILHTWAMLLFAKTESFLHINIPRNWRQFMILLQIGFIVLLTFSDYQLSLIILAFFLFIAKISNLLFFESLWCYSISLQKDRFDAEYWWQKKKKSPKYWQKSINHLLKKRYLNSVVRIIWEFLKNYQKKTFQSRYANTILKAWVELRHYQILPNDLVLSYQHSTKKTGQSAQAEIIIGTACNLYLMEKWILLCKEEKRYALLLHDYLKQLARELESYIQKPFPMSNALKETDSFIQELDQFMKLDLDHLQEEQLDEQIKYCYGLFYMTSGIAKNL